VNKIEVWAKLGEQIFKFLDTIFDPAKQNYRRLIKKVKYANRAKRAFRERNRLRTVVPRTQNIIQKIMYWEDREAKIWDKFDTI
jgi:hypothetical protein